MADVNGSLKLKRKRESAEAQRKKAKTQKKGQNEAATPVKDAPVAASEPGSTPKGAATPTPKKTPKSGSQKSTENTESATGTPTSSRKEKQKKKDVANGGKDASSETALQVLPVDGAVVSQTPKKQKPKKNKEKGSEPWSASEAYGGWVLPQDPIFSADEKYLLLPKSKVLEVYATDSSLLAAELPASGSGIILTAALSALKPNQVYIIESTGIVTLWDWMNETKVGRWDIGGVNVRRLAIVKAPDSDQDLLFSYEASKSHLVTIHGLRKKDEAGKKEFRKRILKLDDPITDLQVLLQGKIVIATTANRVVVGTRTKLNKTTPQDFEYTWRELQMTSNITALAPFVREPRDQLDLAVGDENGVIHLFENIVSSFFAIERSQKEKTGKAIGLESFRPRRLHWHREAVGAVKWSLDGNYLISGGGETVLTIWQLSTNQRQYLPHLTAAIENIVVSPSGTAYGVTLANNSVIVLSTSELQPKTNIIGIQSRRVEFDQLPHDTQGLFNPVPFAVDPKHYGHVIFASPSSQPRRQQGLLPEPYAQTFDITTRRPILRQALTRNNATDSNVGPDGRKINEPTVKFMQISQNGAWLATVDEWLPPREDMRYIEGGNRENNEEERLRRRQVYLKIWKWDEKATQWVLDARIDAPHHHHDISAHAQVFDLSVDPSGTGFATIGEDRVVRLWRPKTRLRNGTIVRGADKSQGLVTWSLDRSVKIANPYETTNGQPTIRTSRLAFSTDGSVLLAGVSWLSEVEGGVIHIIDVDAGVIRRSITEIDVSPLSGLGIIGRYLIAVGTSVVIWDMVTDQLVHSNYIEAPGLLAVQEEDNTFAVAIPRPEKGGSTRIVVFEPEQPKPRWSRSVPGVALALASAKDGHGYIMLDSSSYLRAITPRSSALQLPTPPADATATSTTEEMEVDDEEDSDTPDAVRFDMDEELLRQTESDRPVVRPEQLQQIFESRPSHALPPVKDLFDAVVGLYARKPRVVVS